MKEYLLEKYCPEYFDVLTTIESFSEEELNMINKDYIPDDIEDLNNHIKIEILWDVLYNKLFEYFYEDTVSVDDFVDELYEDLQGYEIIDYCRKDTYFLYIDDLISFIEDVTKVPIKIKNHFTKADLSLYLNNDEYSYFKFIIK
jgi:hypothetical protein